MIFFVKKQWEGVSLKAGARIKPLKGGEKERRRILEWKSETEVRARATAVNTGVRSELKTLFISQKKDPHQGWN